MANSSLRQSSPWKHERLRCVWQMRSHLGTWRLMTTEGSRLLIWDDWQKMRMNGYESGLNRDGLKLGCRAHKP